MARPLRSVLSGVPLHITQRGNDRIRTFHSERDLAFYHELLVEQSRTLRCAVHAYVLMPNHVHLLLTPFDPRAPARLMQRLGARYVRYVNTTYARTGTLWEGRYRSSIVDAERYVLTCQRYIDLNPVRAQLVSEPALFRWSSFRHNVLGDGDPLVTPHPAYLALGATSGERRDAYAALCASALGPDVLREIRRSVGRQSPRSEARAGTEFAAVAQD